MKKLINISIFSILIISLNLNAAQLSSQATNGQELYLDADCQKCHNQDNQYDAKKKKSKNIANLKTWVTSCDTFFEIGWFPQEQNDVIKYLNEIYYKY